MSTARIRETRPDEGQVRVQVAAIGLSALGTQLAGTVDAVGKESIGFARGDRVAFSAPAPRDSARIIVDERELIGVPADVSLDAAAAVMPCATLARTVVKQVHTIGRGDRVHVADASAIAPFVCAWVDYLGASLEPSDGSADVVVTTADVRTARSVGGAHGTTQQAAADVYAAVRSGAFDGIRLSTPEEARQGSRSPVLLHPAPMGLAA